MIALSGTLICQPEDLAMVQTMLPEHIRLSRAEPGCVMFQVVADRCDPCRFLLAERYVDAAALEFHRARGRASAWGQATSHIPRDIHVADLPVGPA